MEKEIRKFEGTPKVDANWAINLNNPNQTLIENICIIDEGWNTPGVKEDARLISAAPDLLDTLINLLEHADRHDQLLTWDIDIARQVVNKALGISTPVSDMPDSQLNTIDTFQNKNRGFKDTNIPLENIED